MTTYNLSWVPSSTSSTPDSAATFSSGLTHVQSLGVGIADPAIELNGVLDLRKWCPPVDNQLNEEDCVADSSTTSLELVEIRDGMSFVKKSRFFLYYNARMETRDTDRDKGSYIHLAFYTLTTLGTCTEATWPYDESKVNVRPDWSAYREAYAHKINTYYRIDATSGDALVQQIKQALQAQHPVVFGMIVDQDYMDTGSDGLVSMPKATRLNSGGHAQCIVGYDDNRQCWIVKNSWGTGWGDAGFAYVPWAYLDVSGANDFLVPVKSH